MNEGAAPHRAAGVTSDAEKGQRKKETGRKPHSLCALRIAQARYVFNILIYVYPAGPPSRGPSLSLDVPFCFQAYSMRMWHPRLYLPPMPMRHRRPSSYPLPSSAQPNRLALIRNQRVARPYSIIHRPMRVCTYEPHTSGTRAEARAPP